jgi:hypothetical protein
MTHCALAHPRLALVAFLLCAVLGCDRSPTPAAMPAPSPPKVPETGNVDLLVSWQSPTLGSQPDTGAIVFIWPWGSSYIDGKLLELEGAQAEQDLRQQRAEKLGGSFALAGGDGHALLDRAKPGKYHALIISANAAVEPKPYLWEMNKAILASLVTDVKDTGLSYKQKMFLFHLEVAAGQTLRTNHHFAAEAQ